MKVIDPKNLPIRWSVWPPITTVLFLDKIHAPEWIYGACLTFFIILFGFAFYGQSKEEKTDIFK